MKKTFTILILFCFVVSTGSYAKTGQPKKHEAGNPLAMPYSIGNADPFSTQVNFNSYNEMMKKKRRKKKSGRKSKGGSSFDQGNIVISAGYGFPNLTKSVYKAYSSYLDYKVTGTGPIHVKVEYGITESFGIGLSVNNVSTKVSWQDEGYDTAFNPVKYESGFKFHAIAFNVRGNYHFIREDNLDLYAGLGLGYNSSKSEYYTNDPYSLGNLTISALIPLGLEFSVGIRYYFTDNIGVYMEVGAAKSIIQGGLAIKI
ncbi:MAG: hypothetical protein NTU44_19555 [Bacteroidetes bacterium]|nr:hypothetical protein [Bacteroidota bacterium]